MPPFRGTLDPAAPAAAAIDWLCSAFGFARRLVVSCHGNRIEHSEVSHGGAVIMVSSSKPEMGRLGPGSLPGPSQALSLHVDAPDAHYRKASAAGAVGADRRRADGGGIDPVR